MQEDRVPVLHEPLQGVAFSFDERDHDVAVPGFLLFPDQYQVPVVDAGAGHAVAAGVEHEEVSLSEDRCRQLDDLFDGFLLQGEVSAGDASDDADGDGFFTALAGEIGEHVLAVVTDLAVLRHGPHHPLERGAGNTGSGGDLPRGRRLVVVPVEVIHKGNDPVHIAQVSVLHDLPPQKWTAPVRFFKDSITRFFRIARSSIGTCATPVIPVGWTYNREYVIIHRSYSWKKRILEYMVKDRLLVLLQILQEHTDDETALTTSELLELMEKEGQEGCKRTLRRNIASLQNCGYDICVTEANGMPTEYAYLGRKWSMPTLQILVDAVSAAQFIPQNRSDELISELSAMAGPSHVNELRPQILVSEHVKAKNPDMIYTVQAIRRAIDRNRKISFQYLQYNLVKQQVPKHKGTPEEEYVVSPYATVWNDDRYYLVGWSDKRQKVAVFRIDRMKVPKQLPNRRVPPPEDFDIRDYTDKVFRMYGGPEETVTLRCRMELLDQVIDRFGDQVAMSLSTTFYAWVFQFVGQMSIVGPEHVRLAYAGYLEEALDDALGE